VEKNSKEVWSEGFAAGRALDSHCPYPPGSPWAKSWLEGWAAGLHAPGSPPATRIPPPPAQGWKAFFRRLLGH
jgi:hypothetical protein